MKNITINGSDVVKEHLISSDDNTRFSFGVDLISDKNYSYFDMHYELEIGIVLSGSITRYYSNTSIELGPGQIWLSGIWEAHGLKVNTTPTEIAIFFIKPDAISNMDIDLLTHLDLIAPFFSSPDSRPQIYNELDRKIALDIGKRAKESLLRNSKNQYTFLKLLTVELLTFIQENWCIKREETKKQINNYIKVNPALNLIFHSKKLIPVKIAAKECGLSEKSFSRSFKATMGITFTQYSLEYRVRSSANDLVKKTLPIKDIVYNWGFTDESHYNKLFHKYYNCNPGEYRKLKKK